MIAYRCGQLVGCAILAWSRQDIVVDHVVDLLTTAGAFSVGFVVAVVVLT